ncbi:5-methylcytosine rRNA methyltransferase NSUN4 [Maniola hyperantus]|uniref:5-methylcytosine rRNA methyltransferase NSUN4 n=1 Tax=Aphantopus hyperantus TaxID=2795564 RepID=UPI0015684941|nr:5-methylcytosine rRNA methyltransferase NSUN4 [Maniola hyperantus]
MITISNIWRRAPTNTYLILQARYKSKTHWAKLKKKTGPKYKALSHFDEFYGSVYGNKWEPIREALLRKSKYVAVVNNYGDAEATMEDLANRGAHCLKNLMSIQKEFHDQYNPQNEPPTQSTSPNNLENYIAKLQSEEIANIYPQGENVPEKVELSEDRVLRSSTEEEVKEGYKSAASLNQAIEDAQLDHSRIIEPSIGISSEALYQYIPATKLKGLDDWVPESLHYSFMSNREGDFPLVIEPETQFVYPEHLKVMTYEMNSEYDKFPEPKRCQTGVFNYYPMDCGSVLSVLALCMSPGDRVLDLCAAPGGKALVALQTLLPDVLLCNDVSVSRANRIDRIFHDYLMDYETGNKWRERVLVTRRDGREFVDDHGFDKVLVDVPCTTDRHSVMEDDNNIFRADRVKERLRIPELQSQLLLNALRVVKVGGAVVYSTCSLSPAQNDGVVHSALKLAFQGHGIMAAVRDISAPFRALSSTLRLATGAIKPKYGQLVLPDVAANFGPSYIARLVRVK